MRRVESPQCFTASLKVCVQQACDLALKNYVKQLETAQRVGAGSGIRTHTELPPMDFESIASARFRHPGCLG